MLYDALLAEPTSAYLDPAPWATFAEKMKSGAHAAVIADAAFDLLSVSMRMGGFEVRDSLVWLHGSSSTVIILGRKPSPLSTTETVRRCGVGALNIEVCRIPTTENLNGGAYAKNGSDRYDGYENWRFKRTGDAEFVQPTGRWPSNLLHDGGAAISQALDEQARFFTAVGDRPALRGWLTRLILPSGGALLTHP